MNDDPDTNVRFVKVIETYPCLYDHSRANYCNRDTQDKAWAEISKQFNATGNILIYNIYMVFKVIVR